MRVLFVSDDRHQSDLMDSGHINLLVKMAIEEGVDPVTAVQMATINTAEYFGLKGLGAIAPGYKADLLVIDDLKKFEESAEFETKFEEMAKLVRVMIKTAIDSFIDNNAE